MQKHLKQIIELALAHYHRDKIWKTILTARPSPDSPSRNETYSRHSTPPTARQKTTLNRANSARTSTLQLTEDEYVVFVSLCFRKPFQVADPSLSGLCQLDGALPSALWPQLTSYLTKAFSPPQFETRTFEISTQQHFIIYNADKSDVMLDIVLESKQLYTGGVHGTLQFYACRRELSYSTLNVHEEIEQALIETFVNQLSCFLFMYSLNTMSH